MPRHRSKAGGYGGAPCQKWPDVGQFRARSAIYPGKSVNIGSSFMTPRSLPVFRIVRKIRSAWTDLRYGELLHKPIPTRYGDLGAYDARNTGYEVLDALLVEYI